MTTPSSDAQTFGGNWTKVKLEILRKYLDAYTTALKYKDFSLVYIDAFAGSGYINASAKDSDAKDFITGSAQLAIDIKNKPFDRLIFVDRSPENVGSLQTMKSRNFGRDIRIEHADANEFLQGSLPDASQWLHWRGALFLDPFATEVEWATIEAIARAEILDTWILFPVSAITRMLPVGKKPDDVDPQWPQRLTKIYGGEEWRKLYRLSPQPSMFGDSRAQRDQGAEDLSRIYKEKLKTLFGQRYLDKTKLFLNSMNSPLFEFIFCVGNPSPRAIGTAKKIAEHILDSPS